MIKRCSGVKAVAVEKRRKRPVISFTYLDIYEHPGTLYGQSQTPRSGLNAVPGAHGIVYKSPLEHLKENV